MLAFPSDGSLSVGLLSFQFNASDAPVEAETDVTGSDCALTVGGVVRVDALAASTNGIENVVGVEKQ